MEKEIVDRTEQISSYGYVVKNSSMTVLDASIKMAFKLFEARRDLELRERALELSNARFEEATRQSRTCFWEIDADGVFTFISPIVREILGFTPEEIVGKRRFFDLSPDPHRAFFRGSSAGIFSRKESFSNLVHPVETREGEIVWLSTSGLPLLNPDGSLRGYRGSDTDITKLQKAEESRRESEVRNRAILNAIPDIMFLYSREGIYIDCHASDEELLIAPLKALLGRSLRDVLPPDIAERHFETFEKAYETGHTEVLEYSLDVMGGRRFFEARIVPIDESRLLSIIRDVSGKRLAEEALRTSEERFRAIVENVPIGMTQSTPEGKFLYVNPAFAAMLGYDSPAELIATVEASSIAEAIYENPARRTALVSQVTNFPGTWKSFNNRYRRKDGRVVDASLTLCEPLNSRPGNRFLYSFAQDITESTRIERKLQASEERYRALVENQGEGVGIVDTEERFVFANPAAESIFGVGPGGLIGRSLSEFLGPADWEKVTSGTDERRSGQKGVYELDILRPDGARRTILVTATPRFNAERQLDGSYGVFRDVTGGLAGLGN